MGTHEREDKVRGTEASLTRKAHNMTLTATDISERIADMSASEAVEVRFTAPHSGNRYQLLASVTTAGTVNYTLHTDPHGNYSHSFPSSLYKGTSLSVPMKAYKGWQAELMTWLCSISKPNGEPVYAVTEVL